MKEYEKDTPYSPLLTELIKNYIPAHCPNKTDAEIIEEEYKEGIEELLKWAEESKLTFYSTYGKECETIDYQQFKLKVKEIFKEE